MLGVQELPLCAARGDWEWSRCWERAPLRLRRMTLLFDGVNGDARKQQNQGWTDRSTDRDKTGRARRDRERIPGTVRDASRTRTALHSVLVLYCAV